MMLADHRRRIHGKLSSAVAGVQCMQCVQCVQCMQCVQWVQCVVAQASIAAWVPARPELGMQVSAGHDENEQTEKMGSPVERMLKMAKAMLEVVRNFKSIKGTPLQIRIGGAGGAWVSCLLSCSIDGPLMHSWPAAPCLSEHILPKCVVEQRHAQHSHQRTLSRLVPVQGSIAGPLLQASSAASAPATVSLV